MIFFKKNTKHNYKSHNFSSLLLKYHLIIGNPKIGLQIRNLRINLEKNKLIKNIQVKQPSQGLGTSLTLPIIRFLIFFWFITKFIISFLITPITQRRLIFCVESQQQIGLLESSHTLLGFYLRRLHDIIILPILIAILFVVSFIKINIFSGGFSRTFFSRSPTIEGLWILLPLVILFFIGVPSITALYLLEDPTSLTTNCRIKITGYQWYWVYEIGSWIRGINKVTPIQQIAEEREELFRVIEVYKDREREEEVSQGDILRNFRSSERLWVEAGVPTRLLVTAGDVIHRWTIPSLFIKTDAIPGRLNQVDFFFPSSGGVFFGQCSELCGVNHRFIPISLSIIEN